MCFLKAEPSGLRFLFLVVIATCTAVITQPSVHLHTKERVNQYDAAQCATGLRRCGDHAIAPIMLGAIQRHIGALQHIGNRLAFSLQRR